MKTFEYNYVDIRNRRIYPAEIKIENGVIVCINELKVDATGLPYILPGFVDAHIHIESSMMTPAYFAYEAVKHGTVATVSDPHEIANVCGVDGVHYMINNARTVPLKFAFGAPSCVPATPFETAGARLDIEDIRMLLQHPEIYYLAEVMNYPSVIQQDPFFMEIIGAAQLLGKPIDGHAPALRHPLVEKYFSHGITTDHECVHIDEALEKIKVGCKILIREGSAAKNYSALAPLISNYADNLMFCSDDKHPDELVNGHINTLVRRAIADGYDMFAVLKMACLNPVSHYGLSVGTMRIGEPADFIIINNLKDFSILETWIDGACVYSGETVHFKPSNSHEINKFNIDTVFNVQHIQFDILSNHETVPCNIIEAIEGQLITNKSQKKLNVIDGKLQPDIENDILKCVVVNRYNVAKPAIGFVQNFGLKKGAIVSSVTHDSHNIIAIGCDDESLINAINTVVENKGGMGYFNKDEMAFIPLEIAGLMTQENATKLSNMYTNLNNLAQKNGCKLKAPFMTLSFLALPVIPQLKMTDLGLFDVNEFQHVSLIVEP